MWVGLVAQRKAEQAKHGPRRFEFRFGSKFGSMFGLRLRSWFGSQLGHGLGSRSHPHFEVASWVQGYVSGGQGRLALEFLLGIGSAQVRNAGPSFSDPSSSMATSGPDLFLQANPVITSWAAALGERLCSLLKLSESGSPLVRSIFKQTLK